MADENLPEYCRKQILVLGCGNILFGDDGFGPAVIKHLKENYEIPYSVCALDIGTGARQILFTLVLSEKKPDSIIVIDAVDVGRKPGEIFEIPLEEMPVIKTDDFSIHQVPSSNLLRELRDFCNVRVTILVCQVGHIPESVQPSLSEPVKKAIPKMCEIVMKKLATRKFKAV
jgi:coenzyme F420 hydrogenase subunit delta